MKQKSTNVAKDQHENPARTQSIQFQSNQVIALDKGMHACVVEYGLYNVGTVPCRGGGYLHLSTPQQAASRSRSW